MRSNPTLSLLLAGTLAAMLSPGSSQAQNTFERLYSFTGTNIGLRDAGPIGNNGFFLCGIAFAQPWRSFVVRAANNGDTLWTRRFSAQHYRARPTNDGGLIMSGTQVTRLAADGLPMWSKTYNGGGAGTIHQTSDGGYIMTGFNMTNSILKVDAAGTPQWQRFYDHLSSATEVRQTNDGGYMILGGTTTVGAGGVDLLLIKTDAQGEVQWFRTYGGPDSDSPVDMDRTADGGFVLLGSSNSFGAGSMDLYVLRIAANGQVLWSQTFGGTDQDDATSVHVLPDGGILLGGSTMSWGETYRQYVVKLAPTGGYQWSRTYGGFGDSQRTVARPIDANAYMVAGPVSGQNFVQLTRTDGLGMTACADTAATIVGTATTITTTPTGASFPGSPSDATVTDDFIQGCNIMDPCITTGVVEPSTAPRLFQAHPNPTQSLVQLSFTDAATHALVEVLDPRGAVVQQRALANGPLHTLDLAGNAPGLYSIRVVSRGAVQVERVVLE